MITAIINGHNEGYLLQRAINSALIAAGIARESGIKVDVMVYLDTPDPKTLAVANAAKVDDVFIDYHRDLGISRNEAAFRAKHDTVAFLDGDDVWSANWLAKAWPVSEANQANAVYHPQFNALFDGSIDLVHATISSIDPSFDCNDMFQFNQWAAPALMHKSVLQCVPYKAQSPGFGFEDWQFHCDTLAAGIAHIVIPDTVYFARRKSVAASLCARGHAERRTMRPTLLFDSNHQRKPPQPFNLKLEINREAYKQFLLAHEVEPRIWLDKEKLAIERYPRSKLTSLYWDLHQATEGKEHLVLMPNATIGGAEAAGIRLHEALPNSHVILCESGPRTWVHKIHSCSDIDYHPDIEGSDRALVLGRLILQRRPKSVHVINSGVGWLLLNTHAEAFAALGIRTFVHSYNSVRVDGRQFSPAFYQLDGMIDHVTGFVSDNARWPAKLRELFGYSRDKFHYVPSPVAEYASARQRDGEQMRVLWWGRMAPEKGPDLLVEIIKLCPEIHFHLGGFPYEQFISFSSSRQTLEFPNVTLHGEYDSFEDFILKGWTFGAYLLTSKSEGLPNSMLEAMSAGIPVLATKVGGVVDVLSDRGMQLDRDPALFAQWLNAFAAGDKLADTLAERALQYVRAHHHLAAYQERMRALSGVSLG